MLAKCTEDDRNQIEIKALNQLVFDEYLGNLHSRRFSFENEQTKRAGIEY